MIRQALSATALRTIGLSVNLYALFSHRRAGEWAFDLFSSPRPSKSRTHHPDLSAYARWKQRPGRFGPISYFHWPGKGPTILLAHGWESNASRWLPLVEALRAHDFDLLALDAPAHGHSGGQRFYLPLYAEWLSELMEAYRPAAVVGHSAGGMALTYLLHRQPFPDLRRVVLLATPSELVALMDTFRQILGMNDRVFEGLQTAFAQRFGRPMDTVSVRNYVRSFSIPGLLIHDRQDEIVHYSEAEAIHRNWEGSRLLLTEGLGHSLRGAEVVRTVTTYLTDSL